MTTYITKEEAVSILNQMVALPISGIKHTQENTVVIGIGPVYAISNLILDEKGNFCTENSLVPKYELIINSDIHYSFREKHEDTLDKKIDNTRVSQIKQALCGQVLTGIVLLEDNIIELFIGPYKIRTVPEPSGRESWRISQPNTEEDQLVGYNDRLIKCVRQKKRWSKKYADVRDRWHTLPLDDGDCSNCVDGSIMLQKLFGTKLTYGVKSADINLFDIGFQDHINAREYALHIACSLTIFRDSDDGITFWGDTSKETFDVYFTSLIGQEVKKVILLQENVLRIVMENQYLEITPADDGVESWRLFASNSDSCHLVAADKWMVLR